MARLVALAAALAVTTASHVFTPRVGNTPPWPATWQVSPAEGVRRPRTLRTAARRTQANASTIVMPCNDSGLFDPVFASQCAWQPAAPQRSRSHTPRTRTPLSRAVGVVDFDWSNGKQVGGAQGQLRRSPP